MAKDTLARQKLTVREVFYEFFNNKKLPVVQKHFSYNFLLRINNYRLTGSIGLVSLVNSFHTLFPQSHIEITSIFSEGDMVCAQWTMVLKSINGGENIYTTAGITTFRFRSGKIIQVEQQWNVPALQDASEFTAPHHSILF